MFQETVKNRVFQDVTDQVEAAIFDGRLKPGDKLPPERELMVVFKTSRGTLREALRVLEQKGLITIKTGVKGGAYVRAASTEPMVEGLALLIRQRRVSLALLAEFREVIEGVVAGLAARRAGPEDIARLKRLMAQAEEHVAAGAEGWDAFYEIETQLHLSLAAMTGNPLFEWVLTTVHENIHTYFGFLSKQEANLREAFEDWLAIVAAIESGDAEAAGAALSGHVARFIGYMSDQVQGDKPWPDPESCGGPKNRR